MNKRHYEHTLPNIRGSLSNTYYHTAIYKYGYTIIHGCDGDGFSHPVTDHDATRKKATAAEKKRMAGTIMESGK